MIVESPRKTASFTEAWLPCGAGWSRAVPYRAQQAPRFMTVPETSWRRVAMLLPHISHSMAKPLGGRLPQAALHRLFRIASALKRMGVTAVLTAERTALNFLQLLSGVATKTISGAEDLSEQLAQDLAGQLHLQRIAFYFQARSAHANLDLQRVLENFYVLIVLPQQVAK